MNLYALKLQANPGIYGTDDQGNPWAAFSLMNGSTLCDECGVEITHGYVRGKWGDEQLHICVAHVRTQVGAHIDILTALRWRIQAEEASV
jgi:hypothetical protein